MASLNKVFLMGNLTRDPELRYIPSGTAIAKFGLAINRKYKHGDEWKEDTCFVEITVWGKQGENCNEYLSKGRPVLVEGRLNYSAWTTEEGQKRSKLDVTADRVVFLGGRGDGEGKYSDKSGSSSQEPPADDDVPF